MHEGRSAGEKIHSRRPERGQTTLPLFFLLGVLHRGSDPCSFFFYVGTVILYLFPFVLQSQEYRLLFPLAWEIPPPPALFPLGIQLPAAFRHGATRHSRSGRPGGPLGG